MRHDTLLGRIGRTLTFSLGYLLLHLMAVVLVSFGLLPYFQTHPEQYPATIVISDGRPIKQMPWQLTQSWTFQSLDGQPLTLPENHIHQQGTYLVSSTDAPTYERLASQSVPWNIVLFTVPQDRNEPWYFVKERIGDQFTAYFVVYSNRTREPITYLGANGKCAALPPPDQRFQLARNDYAAYFDNGQSMFTTNFNMLDTGSHVGSMIRDEIVLLTRRGLEIVHFKEQSVELVLAATDLKSQAPFWNYEFVSGHLGAKTSPDQYSMLVRGAESVYLVQNGQIRRRYEIPESIRDQNLLTYPVDDNTIFYGTQFGHEPLTTLTPNLLVKCNAAGTILESIDVTQPDRETMVMVQQASLMLSVMFPVPLQLVATLGLLGGQSMFTPGREFQEIWPSGLLLLCGSIASVGIALRLSPKYLGKRVEWGWLAYVFVFGLPGLIGYIVNFRGPRRPELEPEVRLGTEIFG